MNDNRSIASEYYVAGELSNLILSYLDQEQMTAKKIRRELLAFPRGSRMPITVWWRILEELQAEKKDPAFGFKLGQQTQLHHSGILGYLIAHSNNVMDAYSCVERHPTLLHNYGPLKLDLDENSVLVSWDYQGKLSTQLSDEVFLSATIAILNLATGRNDLTPIELRFNHPKPSMKSDYTAIANCPVTYNCEEIGIRFNHDILEIPINCTDPHVLEILDRHSHAFQSNVGNVEPILKAVENCIIESLPNGTATGPEIASKLNISRRTLYRRLEKQGINFKGILQETRVKLAKFYLKDQNLTLSDITFLLGYSEQSAFSRAFKIWTGISPKAYLMVDSFTESEE